MPGLEAESYPTNATADPPMDDPTPNPENFPRPSGRYVVRSAMRVIALPNSANTPALPPNNPLNDTLSPSCDNIPIPPLPPLPNFRLVPGMLVFLSTMLTSVLPVFL